MNKVHFQSDLNHVALQMPDSDLWCVGYQVPGTNFVNVLMEGCSENTAKREARQLNFPRSTPVRPGWRPDKAVYASF